MSPILLRPIREQFEHDRVIRQLQARWRRRFAVAINPGRDETASVRSESRPVYPDLVLTSTDHGRRHHGVAEVETTESVNHLEAMAEWAHLSKVRGSFYLYVPAGSADMARRLCEDNGIAFTEIWTYYAVGRQVRFSMVHRSAAAERAAKARKTRAAATGAGKVKTPVAARKARQRPAKRAGVKKKSTKAKTAKKSSAVSRAATRKPARQTRPTKTAASARKATRTMAKRRSTAKRRK